MLAGAVPPRMPACARDPRGFQTLEEVAAAFGKREPDARAACGYCVPFRVPAGLADRVGDTDLHIIDFSRDKVTPLLHAASSGDAAGLGAALAAAAAEPSAGQPVGAQPAVTVDADGVSLLMMACSGGEVPLVELLLRSRADPNYTEPTSKRTALMFAAQAGHADAVQSLLAAKHLTCAAAGDDEGCTALMWAATSGREECVAALRDTCRRDATNCQGETALAIAEKIVKASGTGEAMLKLLSP